MPASVLSGYIEGEDPDTGKLIIDEIVDALTKPVNKKDLTSDSIKTSNEEMHQAFLAPDTEDNLQNLFFEKGWTDGLPIFLPTEERVNNMLTGTNHAPDELVGQVFRFDIKEQVTYTVKDVAVIAVMAGARPEHFPVLLAIASTKEPAMMPSTTPFASMLLVNGPIRRKIGMNCGKGAFSPINMANSVIGRAWSLMTLNWGFTRRKTNFWSSQGNGIAYNNMCVAENEESSVWNPFHVQKGFKADESVVSVFRGWSVLNSMGAAAFRSHGEEMTIQLKAFPALRSSATLIMDPLVAKILKENEGFNTKEEYSQWLSQNVRMTAGRFWGTDYIDMLVAPLAHQGVEPYASWKKLPDNELIAPYHDPGKINIIVVGGETSPVWKAADFSYMLSTSIDKWCPKNTDDCIDGTCGLPDEPADYD